MKKFDKALIEVLAWLCVFFIIFSIYKLINILF
jgi:hypothetical protein